MQKKAEPMTRYETMLDVASRYDAKLVPTTRCRVVKPQRRWKYGTHTIYNPRKSWAKGRMLTEKTW